MKLIRNKTGFTLIEIMLSLLIFAIIALIATIGLSSVIKSHERSEADAKRLEQLQMVMAIMQLDFQQMYPRAVVDGRGEQIAVLITRDNYIEFTHGGYTNPLSPLPHSSLERVAYEYKNQQLIRISWPVLDQAPDTQPMQKVLLDPVSSIHIRYLNNQQQFFSSWPPPANANQLQAIPLLPIAVEMTLTLQKWGTIKRLFIIPATGFQQTE